MSDSMDPDSPRITDLSSIDPENFKFRNTEFLKDKEHHYDNPHNKTFTEQRADIWRVRNGDLARLLEDFPIDQSLPEQCALWVHAVVGKHFFEDANHRTAIALLRKLLRDNGIDPGNWPTDRVKQARDESHDVRRKIQAVHLDTLYEEDELYCVWLRFFTDVLPEEYL
jgi:prophage maintenance system killer protein